MRGFEGYNNRKEELLRIAKRTLRNTARAFAPTRSRLVPSFRRQDGRPLTSDNMQ